MIFGTAAGFLLSKLEPETLFFVLGGVYVLIGILQLLQKKKFGTALVVSLIGMYIMSANWATQLSKPIANFSRSLGRGFWSNAIFQFADHFKTLLQPPPSLIAIAMIVVGVVILANIQNRWLNALALQDYLCLGLFLPAHHAGGGAILWLLTLCAACQHRCANSPCNKSIHPSKQPQTVSAQMRTHLPQSNPAHRLRCCRFDLRFTRHMTTVGDHLPVSAMENCYRIHPGGGRRPVLRPISL